MFMHKVTQLPVQLRKNDHKLMEKIKQWVRGKVKIADKGLEHIWTRRLSMGTELQLGKAAEWGGGGSRFGTKEQDRNHRKKKSRRKGQAIVGWDAVVTLKDVQRRKWNL